MMDLDTDSDQILPNINPNEDLVLNSDLRQDVNQRDSKIGHLKIKVGLLK